MIKFRVNDQPIAALRYRSDVSKGGIRLAKNEEVLVRSTSRCQIRNWAYWVFNRAHMVYKQSHILSQCPVSAVSIYKHVQQVHLYLKAMIGMNFP